MAKLRHLAIMVEDREASTEFFKKVFELDETYTLSGDWGSVTYLTDGMIAIALLQYDDPTNPRANAPLGLNHIGFVVEDLKSAVTVAEESGAETTYAADSLVDGEVWEHKMKTPDGLLFEFYDLNGRGWPGIGGLQDYGVTGEITVEAHRDGNPLRGTVAAD